MPLCTNNWTRRHMSSAPDFHQFCHDGLPHPVLYPQQAAAVFHSWSVGGHPYQTGPYPPMWTGRPRRNLDNLDEWDSCFIQSFPSVEKLFEKPTVEDARRLFPHIADAEDAATQLRGMHDLVNKKCKAELSRCITMCAVTHGLKTSDGLDPHTVKDIQGIFHVCDNLSDLQKVWDCVFRTPKLAAQWDLMLNRVKASLGISFHPAPDTAKRAPTNFAFIEHAMLTRLYAFRLLFSSQKNPHGFGIGTNSKRPSLSALAQNHGVEVPGFKWDKIAERHRLKEMICRRNHLNLCTYKAPWEVLHALVPEEVIFLPACPSLSLPNSLTHFSLVVPPPKRSAQPSICR